MQSLQDMDMEIVTVDQNRNYLGSSSDLVVGQPGPSSGQELVPQPAYEIAVAETPEKKTLRRQVSDLVKALHHKEYMVHQKVHEVKVDAGTKVRALLKDQQDRLLARIGEQLTPSEVSVGQLDSVRGLE